jgi:hypothetical protein
MRSLPILLALLPGVALAQPADPAPTDPTPAPAPADPAPAVAKTEPTTTPPVTATSSVTVGTGVSSKYAGAVAPPPGHWRIMISDLSLFRVNPIGLETRARVGMQKRLYPSAKKISQNNFMFLGAYPRLNPATAMMSLGGEIQPVSIFNLKAFAEVQQYFGTFGLLQSFSTPRANYSDQTLKDLRDSPTLAPQSTGAFHAGIHPMLQMKFGKVAVRSLFQLDYWDFSLRDGDTVAYEPTLDTLIPDKGLTFMVDTDVLYTGKPGLAIGLRHTFVKPFYKQKHFADPNLSVMDNQMEFDEFSGQNSHQRLGLFAAYTMHDRGPSRFNKPTILLIASWYLSHQYRAGTPDALRAGERPDDFTSRAFPYLLLGFAFESDFANVARAK